MAVLHLYRLSQRAGKNLLVAAKIFSAYVLLLYVHTVIHFMCVAYT